MAHDFIAKAFYGPRQRSVQRRLAEFPYPMLLGWTPRFVATIADLLCAWGLEGAPCVIAEDGTALQVSILLGHCTMPTLMGSLDSAASVSAVVLTAAHALHVQHHSGGFQLT